MRFWQLLSIFRDEEGVLKQELNVPRWRKYYQYILNIDSLVRSQNRDVLDLEVDHELLKNVFTKSKKNVFYSAKDQKIYSYSNIDANLRISVVDAIDLFEHDSIEEAFEKTESKVRALSFDQLDHLNSGRLNL